MEISYRRTPPSLLERALGRLVTLRPVSSALPVRIDLVHGVGLEFRRA